MPSSQSAKPKRNIRLDCGRYLVRTIKLDDASDRWASWTSDSGAIETLNTAAKPLSKADLVAYIKRFDQWSRYLLGIFEKPAWKHIGIIRVDVAADRAHISVLIGDPTYRNKGVTADVFMSTLDYVFGTVGIAVMTASVLARNQVTMRYLTKAGWKLDEKKGPAVKSKIDGSPLDLHTMTLTREAWRAWKDTDVAQRLARRINQARATSAAAH